jgi:energy-coupling factor transporter ATP-binding protein EcfA2
MTKKSVTEKPDPVKSTAKPIEFAVDDMGPHHHFEGTLWPGLNLLTGPNGAGKTKLIESLSKALGDENPVEVREGANEGRVTIDGLVMRVTRVATKTGRPEIELEGGKDLAELIGGGGYADEKARAKARIRALCRIERLPVTEENIQILAADPEVAALALRECEDNLIDDVLSAAEKARKVGHDLARAAEASQADENAIAEVRESQARDLVESIGGALVEIPFEEARSHADRLRDRLAVAKSEAQKRRELEALQAEIRQTLGERPDATQFNERYTRAQDAREARESELEALQAQAAEIAAKIAEKRVAVVEAKELQQRIGRKISETQAATENWDHRAGVLGRPVEGPLQAEVEKLERASEAASAAAKRASVSAEYRQNREIAAAARQKAEDHATRAEYLRTVATTVQDRLGKLLNGTDADGLTVNAEGRLCVIEGGKTYDFEKRRSEGQQISAALRHVARRSAGRLVPLEGRFFRAMQPKMQKELAAQAAALGIVLVTEAPSDSEGITIQHFPVNPAHEAAMAEAVAS